ncbi:MAG TPA: hypothetical protein VJU83_09490, partial [Burkholderiales bacterium]|nr:hypothetical protein [Burkholderiales bacterium]
RLEGELTREKALFEKESTARHQERERLATQAAAAAREAAVALKAADDAAAKTAQELAKAFADKETLGHRLSHLEAENERLITEVHGKEAERSALLAQVLHGQNQRKGNKRPSA